MANLILSRRKKLFEVSRFPGVDRRGSSGAYSCRNFRILDDGALEKRGGFSPVIALPSIPRAVWCGNVFGEETIYCLVDNVVCRAECEYGRIRELGSVSSVDGKADFFYCRGGLYLVDGEDVYCVSDDGVERETGYVPVYGRDWSGVAPGRVNEPVNFLSDRIIVHFKLMDASFSYLELGIKCSEILGCTLNGAPYDGTAELANGGTRIRLSGSVPSECEMCFLLRLDGSACRRTELQSVTRATQSGGDSDSKVILFGGKDESRIFALREVDQSSFLISLGMAPDSTEVYFPVTDTLLLGDGRESVTAAVPYASKMLVFTETGAWLGDFSGKSAPKISRINDGVGCLASLGTAVGRYAYSVTAEGIFRWDAGSISRPKCISAPIADLFSAGFCRGAAAHYSPSHGEVWFSDPYGDVQIVYVYREETGDWYTFDPVPADRFFTLSGHTVMLCGKYLLEFLDHFTVDTTIGDMEPAGNIEAEYLSPNTDLGFPDSLKKIRRIMSGTRLDGEDLEIAVFGDRMKKPITLSVKENDGGRGTTYSDSRVNTGRFGRMYFSVRASGRGRVRVDKLSFAVFK